jgi:hypothetical protein
MPHSQDCSNFCTYRDMSEGRRGSVPGIQQEGDEGGGGGENQICLQVERQGEYN